MNLFGLLTGLGILCLLAATVYLVVMNWSDEMYPRLISALGAGAFTLLVAVLAALKSSHEESRFTTTVILDQSTGRPPIVMPAPGRPATQAVQNMSNLAMTAAMLDARPVGADEVFAYLSELLQYELLADIKNLQVRGTGVMATLGVDGPQIIPGTIVPSPDPVEISLSEIRGNDSNRFFGTKRASFEFEGMPKLRVPRGATVEVTREGEPASYLIVLSRPDYFTLKIAIQSVLGAPGMNLGPEAVAAFEGSKGPFTTYVFDVTMRAEFEKLTAGNWRTAYYKRWVSWLMSELSRNRRIT